MKTAWAIVYGVACALLVGGILYFVSRPPRGQAVMLLPAPTPAPVTVYVAGAVNQPGVYEMPRGSRVQDAIQEAGGFLPDAALEALNLASVLQDGQRVWVRSSLPISDTARTGISLAQELYPIDINLASQEKLETLPGIGAVTAQKIIAYRDEHGDFATTEQILNVPGIGPATYQSLKDLITVQGEP